MKFNLGPGPYYEDGWVNIEVHEGFEADVYLEDPMVLPFDSECVSKVYAGHILEHIEWEKVPTYLEEIHRVMEPGATLLIVGPDIFKGLDMWRDGELEDDLSQLLEWGTLQDWDAPRHYWNCFEDRVISLLSKDKWEIRSVPIDSEELDEWPVVSRVEWQMALFAVKKGN